MAAATSGSLAREVSWSIPSRTSVTSENMTVAPARTSRSVAKPTAGLAVTPENASLPPHCTPTTRSAAEKVSRPRAFSTFSCSPAVSTVNGTTGAGARCAVLANADDSYALHDGAAQWDGCGAKRQYKKSPAH